jgi:hypothetical protein
MDPNLCIANEEKFNLYVTEIAFKKLTYPFAGDIEVTWEID